MFNGSENYNKDYFKQMENIGATDLNGTTNEDHTNYFQMTRYYGWKVIGWATCLE
jgi:zinc protease